MVGIPCTVHARTLLAYIRVTRATYSYELIDLILSILKVIRPPAVPISLNYAATVKLFSAYWLPSSGLFQT